MKLSLLEDLITSKECAIFVDHCAGAGSEMDAIMNRHNISVIKIMYMNYLACIRRKNDRQGRDCPITK
jgi:hypothetical protein